MGKSWTKRFGRPTQNQKCRWTGKSMFDKRGAQTAKNALEYEQGVRLRIYVCPNCGKWHLTSRV